MHRYLVSLCYECLKTATKCVSDIGTLPQLSNMRVILRNSTVPYRPPVLPKIWYRYITKNKTFSFREKNTFLKLYK
jgi:hypothetical protein